MKKSLYIMQVLHRTKLLYFHSTKYVRPCFEMHLQNTSILLAHHVSKEWTKNNVKQLNSAISGQCTVKHTTQLWLDNQPVLQ